MVELNFEKIFKLVMICMKISQCHPETKINKYWVLRSIMIFGVYTLSFLGLSNCIRYYLIGNDYFNAFKNGVPIIYYVCMMLNFGIFIKKRFQMRNLIESMKSDYSKACAMDKRSKKIVQGFAAKGRLITIFWGYLMVGTLCTFIVKSIFLTIYHSKRSGELRLTSFYEVYYPFNISELRVYNTWVYVPVYLFEVYFTGLTELLILWSTTLGPIFMLHACGQLELVKIQFDNIFENDNVDENLNRIVKRLQYIYSFVREINECFTLMYEVMLKQSVLLLPFCSFALIQSIKRRQVTVEFSGVLLQSVITSSIPCYYGDLLLQKGEDLRFAAYNCGWERVHKPKACKTLLIIMTRATRPVAIESIFSSICLDTLTNVFSQAYTIFNLCLQFGE
uniref:Odorant receptor n=2 Tax=Dendrolimus punctatus TaxID=238572 RepID=A0A2K8GL51_9NEOP|nr:Odorant Receptor 45-2 [Dendrolimus punctatus]